MGSALGSLPSGLTLNRYTGIISGIPTEAGTFRFMVSVSGGIHSASRIFTIIIDPPRPVPPPVTPPAPPAVGQIAFASIRDDNREIYVMNADGTNQRHLSGHGAHDWSPTWSPDGTRAAFMSNRDGNAEIYVMNTDGTNVRRLTNNPHVDKYPAWSPVR